ncbi:MAG: PAS domain-containing protein, partial [Phormidesmis sp.]
MESQDYLRGQIDALSAKVQQLESSLHEASLASHQLEQNATVLEGIFDAITDAVIFADTERYVRKVNPAFCRLFAYPPASILDQTTEQLYECAADYITQGEQRFNPQASSNKSV